MICVFLFLSVFRHDFHDFSRSPGGLDDGGIQDGAIRLPYQYPLCLKLSCDLFEESVEEIEIQKGIP